MTESGLGPETIHFDKGFKMEVLDFSAHYLLRPEAVESFFILHKLTGDPVYREWGWEVFNNIERFCKAETAYGGRNDVNEISEDPTDKMESFFLSETLKYLYLLFDPESEIDILHKVCVWRKVKLMLLC